MDGDDDRDLWASEVIVGDLIGHLIEFWGFKRNMGRVWSMLYLSPNPLSAKDLQDTLKLSAGAVSMTLSELGRWGVIKRVWVLGKRRDYYAAEVQLWKMISRVFAEREGGEIRSAIEGFEQALAELKPLVESDDESVRQRAQHQQARILALLGVAKIGQQLLESLVNTAKLDAQELSEVELDTEQAPSEAGVSG